MNQDSFKSFVYRSFITCNDPKGVVDCGVIRKFNIQSKKTKNKSEKRKISVENSENFHSPSSFQLLEVSREVQKLNHTIESWAKGLSFDGQSKDIANDLMSGALDLQESLVMLGKLQEASNCIAKLKKKHKEKIDIERIHLARFEDQNYQSGLRSLRISNDGSSENSFDELRRSIQEGLAKKINEENQENFNYDLRKLDSPSEFPFTSSSQSSTISSNNLAKFKNKYVNSERFLDQSFPPQAQNFPTVLQKSKYLDNGFSNKTMLPNLINQEKGNFDLRRSDMGSEGPSTSSSQSSNVYSNNLCSITSSYSSVNQEKTKIPNVIAKLMGLEAFPSNSASSEKKSIKWKPVFDIGMPKARKPREIDPRRKRLQEVLDTMRFKGLLKNSSFKERSDEIIDMPPIVIMKTYNIPFHENLTRKDESMDTRSDDIPKELEVKHEIPPTGTDSGKRNSHSNEKQGNVKVKEKGKSIKRITQKGNPKDLKLVVSRPEERKVKTNEKVSVSSKIKLSVPSHTKLQKKEVTDKLVKVGNDGLTGKINAETKNMWNSQNALATLKKPKQHLSSRDSNQTSTKPLKRLNSSDSKNQTKKGKKAAEPTSACLMLETTGSNYDDMKINETCDNEIVIDETETETSKIDKEEHCIDASIKEENAHKESFNTQTTFNKVLMSSPSFLNNAHELFDLDVHHLQISQILPNTKVEESDMKLSLDCANELIKIKNLRESQTWSLSIENLVDEVYDEIESLRSYSKMGCENFPIDGVYSMLDRDLKCKGLGSSIWESGWKNGFSRSEVEQVVDDVERRVLGSLIEEFFTDFTS